MVALLIAVGALFIAVIGCALIDSGPSAANEGVDQEPGPFATGCVTALGQ